MSVSYKKSFAYLKPWAVKYWSPDNELGPDEVAAGSDKKFKFEFVTPNGIPYTWISSAYGVKLRDGVFTPPAERKMKGMLLVPGYNTFSDIKPWAVPYWSPDNQLSPIETAPDSGRPIKLDFVAPNGVEYSWMTIPKRVTLNDDGMFIPPAERERPMLVPGYNSFLDIKPWAAKYWSEDNNVSPSAVSPVSNEKFLFSATTPNGIPYSWEASLNNILLNPLSSTFVLPAERGSNGLVVVEGYNDLCSSRKDLMSEWDWDKNTEIDPNNVSLGTNSKVWWKCKEGHEWEATINSRTSAEGTGCLSCSIRTKTSKPEKLVVGLLNMSIDIDLSKFVDSSKFRTIDGHKSVEDFDFFLDYDGSYHHSNIIDRDTRKTKLLLDSSDKYFVIRIREQTRKRELPLLGISNERFLQIKSQPDVDSLSESCIIIQDWMESSIQ